MMSAKVQCIDIPFNELNTEITKYLNAFIKNKNLRIKVMNEVTKIILCSKNLLIKYLDVVIYKNQEEIDLLYIDLMRRIKTAITMRYIQYMDFICEKAYNDLKILYNYGTYYCSDNKKLNEIIYRRFHNDKYTQELEKLYKKGLNIPETDKLIWIDNIFQIIHSRGGYIPNLCGGILPDRTYSLEFNFEAYQHLQYCVYLLSKTCNKCLDCIREVM